MITPGDIRQKAARLYLPYLRAWLQEEAFFPLDFPVGKLPTDYLALRKAVRDLLAQSKTAGPHHPPDGVRKGSSPLQVPPSRLVGAGLAPAGFGYTLEYQVQQKRASGTQTLPVRVIIETEQDFLHLIEKEAEFGRFRQDVALIRARLPQLEDWMRRYPQRVSEQHEIWPDLLAVCRYFLEHPRPHMYIRELPISVHTKFIEQHRGIVRELLEQILPAEAMTPEAVTFEQRFGLREKEPPVRMRLLDEQLQRSYDLPLTELSVPVSQFAALDLLRGQRCIVTENEMAFLTLPPRRDTFALFGGGFMVHNLGRVPWLAECPIFYWGDLDAQGFQILSHLRAVFPHVTSLMMDQETFSSFADFCVESTSCPIRQLPHLTPEEHELFLHLAEHSLRLEQERISHAYALQQLDRLVAR